MPRRLLAVASITSGSILYTLDGGIPNVALPVISEALGIPGSSAVLLVSAYNLVLAMVLLPLAAIGECVGHRKVFVAGLALYLVASTGCVLSTSLEVLVGFRAFQALAAAALLSVSLAMVRMVYPARMLGRGLGFNTMAASLGAAIAPPLGGTLLSLAPWQSVFAAGVPLAVIGLAAARALPTPELAVGKYDKRGALMCALTFGMLIASMQALSEGVPVWLAGAGMAVGAVVATLFVHHENRVSNPVLPVDLLAQSALALSVGGALLAVLASTIILLYLPFRLHALGFGAAAIGAMIAPYAVTVMIAAPVSGMLSDRISATVLGTVGMTIATCGVLTFVWLSEEPTYFSIGWRAAICGLGFSAFFSPNGRIVVGSVARERAAGSSSLLSTTRMFGQALGSVSLSGLLALGLPVSAPFIFSAVLAALGLACSIARMFVARPVLER